MADSFNYVCYYEASAFRNLTYYLEDEAKDVHKAQISDVYDELYEATAPAHARRACKFLIDAFVRHFPT